MWIWKIFDYGLWDVKSWWRDRANPTKHIGDAGEMKIPVPDYFWKIVMKVSKQERKLDTLAMLYPHEEIEKKRSGKNKYAHEDYFVTVDEIEKVTGLDFFTSLPDDMENELEGKKAR